MRKLLTAFVHLRTSRRTWRLVVLATQTPLIRRRLRAAFLELTTTGRRALEPGPPRIRAFFLRSVVPRLASTIRQTCCTSAALGEPSVKELVVSTYAEPV